MNLFSKKEKPPAKTVVEDVCKVKKGEAVLIVANPETNTIAQDLYTAACDVEARPVLVFQNKKSTADFAEEAVIAAIKTEPDVIFSISANKLGKDEKAAATPYKGADGKTFDSTFDWLLSGKKRIRAVWTPGITDDIFMRCVNIDYKQLAERCKRLSEKFANAKSAHITSPAGCDITVALEGRQPMADDGDFSQNGSGGNIPAGEAFISPVVGSSEGVIVFDGSMSFADGDALLSCPITVKVEKGFATDITGGQEAKRLLKDITQAQKDALDLESTGKLPKGQGAVYAKNARNIGELGIGLNPAAVLSGNMLEDEKAFRTCHFAIGENYDGDAPALIHFDGIVKNPTITVYYADGSEAVLLKDGELQI